MEQVAKITTAADNIPIVAMLFIIGFVLWLAFKQAMENDALLDEGRFDEMANNMRN
jgi:hypothetical protein